MIGADHWPIQTAALCLVVVGDAWRQRLELSLRLNGVFAAMAAALVLLHKTVGLAIPAVAMSLFAARIAMGRRRYEPSALDWASITVGVAAAGVALSEYAMMPNPPTVRGVLGWSLLAGLATGGLSRLGLWLATPTPARPSVTALGEPSTDGSRAAPGPTRKLAA